MTVVRALKGVSTSACCVPTAASLEVALVGDEGMVGIPLMLGAETKPLRVLVQRSGKAWRMKAETIRRMTHTNEPLRRELNQYIFSRFAQVAHNAICANAHQIEARLARRHLDDAGSIPFRFIPCDARDPRQRVGRATLKCYLGSNRVATKQSHPIPQRDPYRSRSEGS